MMEAREDIVSQLRDEHIPTADGNWLSTTATHIVLLLNCRNICAFEKRTELLSLCISNHVVFLTDLA